jgi:hypothetical protein
MLIALAVVLVVGAVVVLVFRLLAAGRRGADAQAVAFDATDPATPRPPAPRRPGGRRGHLDVHQP